MNYKRIKSLVAGFLLLSFVVASSSCNRQLGCPNNFSVDKKVDQVEQIQFESNEVH